MPPRYTKKQAKDRVVVQLTDVVYPVLIPIEQQCIEIQLRNAGLINEVSETAFMTFVLGGARTNSLAHHFRNADSIDWDHLKSFIPDSGHGKFWKALFKEIEFSLETVKKYEEETGDGESSSD